MEKPALRIFFISWVSEFKIQYSRKIKNRKSKHPPPFGPSSPDARAKGCVWKFQALARPGVPSFVDAWRKACVAQFHALPIPGGPSFADVWLKGCVAPL